MYFGRQNDGQEKSNVLNRDFLPEPECDNLSQAEERLSKVHNNMTTVWALDCMQKIINLRKIMVP